MYSNITNPKSGEKYSIFSKEGKSILKKYIKVYKSGGSDDLISSVF